MDVIFALLTPSGLSLAVSIALLAGVVKGLVGFAMPMVMISGLSTVLPPDQALAALILPTLVTNIMQATRQGWRAALASVKRFRVFLLVGLVWLLGAAQLVPMLPAQTMLLLLGGPVLVFGLVQLAGWRPKVRDNSRALEVGVGGLAGFVGGISGIWGPPTVLYLTALGTEKTEQMRVQGVIYGLGAVALVVGHVGSGVLNSQTVWLSALMIPSAMLGMWLGSQVQDRIDQDMFRRATLLVLCVAGLKLIRRALL